jgi:hypothetical protein
MPGLTRTAPHRRDGLRVFLELGSIGAGFTVSVKLPFRAAVTKARRVATMGLISTSKAVSWFTA